MGVRSLEDRYKDVHRLIFGQVKKFYLQFGGDFEELVGQALLIFIIQGRRWNTRKRSKFSTWMTNKIWRGLIDVNKRRWKQYKKHPEYCMEDLIAQKLISTPAYSDRGVKYRVELYDRLGKDAQQVVTNVLEPNMALKDILARTVGSKLERRAIRTYFKKYRKWSDDRVDDAFWEIQTVIRS